MRIAVYWGWPDVVYLASPALFKISTYADEMIPFPQDIFKKKFLSRICERGWEIYELSEVEVLHRDKIMWERGINFY